MTRACHLMSLCLRVLNDKTKSGNVSDCVAWLPGSDSESLARAQKQAWSGGHRTGIAIRIIISITVSRKPVV